MNNLTDMEIDEISLVDNGANQEAFVSIYKRKGDNMDMDEIAKRLETAEKQVAFYKGMAQLSDAEKAYTEKMDMDEDALEAFMALTSDERNEKMKQGDMKKMDQEQKDTIQKQLEDIEKRLAEKDEVIAKLSDDVVELSDENEMLRLQKRAEEELSAISGTVEQKAKLLKSLEAIEDEEVRKMALENIKQKSEGNSAFMKEAGQSGSDESDASTKLDKLAKNYADENKTTIAIGYSEVMKTEEGRKLYKESKENK